MTETRHRAEELLEIVQRSPAAVAAKDREAWLSIFAAYNIVEDPVGSRPHISGVFDRASGRRGNGPLMRFFDTFIAPNEIRFEVERDIVSGYAVARDLTIEIRMGPRVVVRVPMHLLYVLGEQGGALRVFRLAAHWELLPMVLQVMRFGLASLGPLTGLGWRMVRIQGLGGVAGFMRALRNIGQRGRDAVAAFARTFNERDSAALSALFAADASGISWLEPGRRVGPAQFLDRLDGRVEFGKTLVSGYVVSVSAVWREATQLRHGLILFEFTTAGKIDRVSAYWAEPQAASSSSSSG